MYMLYLSVSYICGWNKQWTVYNKYMRNRYRNHIHYLNLGWCALNLIYNRQIPSHNGSGTLLKIIDNPSITAFLFFSSENCKLFLLNKQIDSSSSGPQVTKEGYPVTTTDFWKVWHVFSCQFLSAAFTNQHYISSKAHHFMLFLKIIRVPFCCK